MGYSPIGGRSSFGEVDAFAEGLEVGDGGFYCGHLVCVIFVGQLFEVGVREV